MVITLSVLRAKLMKKSRKHSFFPSFLINTAGKMAFIIDAMAKDKRRRIYL